RHHASLTILFFNDTAPTALSTLSLHDALPIWNTAAASVDAMTAPTSRASVQPRSRAYLATGAVMNAVISTPTVASTIDGASTVRSEEHTSELQSRSDLVCRLLLEKKKQKLRRE